MTSRRQRFEESLPHLVPKLVTRALTQLLTKKGPTCRLISLRTSTAVLLGGRGCFNPSKDRYYLQSGDKPAQVEVPSVGMPFTLVKPH